MVNKYAVIKNGTVENIIVAQNGFKLDGYDLIEIQEEQKVNIGDSWDGSNFIPTLEPEPHLPTLEERLAALEVAMLELILGGVE